MTWQAAIDALRTRHFGESDDEYEAPTPDCVQRALAWMEYRAEQEPMHWPTAIDTLANGGVEIRFLDGKELKLQIHFENDGTADWYEWRGDKIIATGTIPFIDPLPTTYQPANAVGEAARTPPC